MIEFYLGKIPVRIEPHFWVLALLIGYLSSYSIIGTALWVVVIFYSVLFHELGHALTALYFGQKAQITLQISGGVTEREGEALPLWKEFFIVFNGPAFGFLLFGLALQMTETFSQMPPWLLYILGATIFVNLYWTLLNLLPIQPLDGGKLLMIVLGGAFGPFGITFSYVIGVVVACLASLYFFTKGFLFAGAIFLFFAFEGAQKLLK
jgi:membrane-associated protease RseP (regulator of RpoE activity)